MLAARQSHTILNRPSLNLRGEEGLDPGAALGGEADEAQLAASGHEPGPLRGAAPQHLVEVRRGHAFGPAGTENLCISKQGLLSEDPCVTWAQRVSDINEGPETSKGDLARVERHDARVVAEVLELVA